MAVAVYVPPRQEKQDPLDLIVKGLQIAGNIYGIKEAQAKLDAIDAAKQSQLAAQEKANNNELSYKEMADRQKEGFSLGTPGVDEGQIVTDPEGYNYALRPPQSKAELRIPTYEPGRNPKNPEQTILFEKTDKGLIPTNILASSQPKDNVEKNPVQAEVNALLSKNANKKSIANQLRSDLAEFQNAETETDKIRLGKQMIKTLNSKEGADAVGAEEVKRLAGALEYQKFNILGEGPAFGRDLPGFEKQVISTINGISGGIDLNNQSIGELTKGYSNPNLEKQVKISPPSKKENKKDNSGKAFASTAQKDPLKMTAEERKAELKRLRGE